MLGNLQELIAIHGYWVIGAIVALESMGVPAPGETILVSAAIYAGTTHQLDITLVILVAATGAILGDNAGYLIGRRFGPTLLERHGRKIGVDARRIRLGHYLFERYGGWVVFLGRFVALLRALSALLAGINAMSWRRFTFFNATGGIVWATVFGAGGYALGEQIDEVTTPLALVGGAGALVAAVVGTRFIARHEAALQRDADRASGL